MIYRYILSEVVKFTNFGEARLPITLKLPSGREITINNVGDEFDINDSIDSVYLDNLKDKDNNLLFLKVI